MNMSPQAMRDSTMRRITLSFLILFSAVFSSPAQSVWTLVGKGQADASIPLMREDSLYWGSGVESRSGTPIRTAREVMSAGTAIADIRVLTYEDGSPLIENNKLYYSVTARTGGSGPSILALDLGTSEMELTGCLVTSYLGYIWRGAATHIMFNRQTGLWQITIPLQFRHPETGGSMHVLAIAKSVSDPRFGVTRFDFDLLDYEKPMPGDEDAQIFWDEDMGKWVMIYASHRQPDGSNGQYILRLQTSDRPDGGFKDYSCFTNVNATGVTSSKVGGKRYVFTGDQERNGRNNYPVFTFPDLRPAGNLNIDIPDGGFRGWNNVTPFMEGTSTRYVFLAFDRGQSTDESRWTYGRLYLYYSRERNEGSEFDIVRSGVRIPASVSGGYGPADLHFIRQGAWNNFFRYDKDYSVIDLSGDVLAAHSNMYPATGEASLVQRKDALYPDRPGDVRVTAGIHHPLANYIIDLQDIAPGDCRYVFLGMPEGVPSLQVRFTAEKDGLHAELRQGGRTDPIGVIPEGTREARFFFTGSGQLYLYAR